MSEMRSDRISDEFDAMRLEVSNIKDWAQGMQARVSASEKISWSPVIRMCENILAKYPQRNVPPVKKGS